MPNQQEGCCLLMLIAYVVGIISLLLNGSTGLIVVFTMIMVLIASSTVRR